MRAQQSGEACLATGEHLEDFLADDGGAVLDDGQQSVEVHVVAAGQQRHQLVLDQVLVGAVGDDLLHGEVGQLLGA